MRLFDTARAEVVDLDPGPLVTMYSCGITPYDSAEPFGRAAVKFPASTTATKRECSQSDPFGA